MTDFILPDIGEGVVECELLEWLVNEGDTVAEDQPVAEVMTDKATVQIPAMHGGVITRLYYQPGDIAKVHAPLFELKQHSEQSQPEQSEIETPRGSDPEPEPVNTDPVGAVETFILPDIGEGIVECEIVKWHVDEGDFVKEDDVVVEVMTDKAVVEIPAKHGGTLIRRYNEVGQVAKVHEALFELSATDATSSQTINSAPAITQTSPQIADKPAHGFQEGNVEPPKVIAGKVPASPAVRRLAKENNLTLDKITATGKKGRVLKQDVLNAMNQPVQKAEQPPASNTIDRGQGEGRTVALTPVQKAMAKQMTRSVSTIPHFTVSDELNMDGLIDLKASLADQFDSAGIKLTFMPFFIKALSLCLSAYPQFNARLSEDGNSMTYLTDHNIGFAVDGAAGLLVPNIKRVQSMSLMDIGQEMQRIVADAREGKVTGADLRDGTISISNVGVLGGTTATPIINHPELAIVALGKIQQLPRFDAQQNVVSQSIMQVSWSADHRVIDGATMVRFNNLWLDYLTNPLKMLSQLH
ncbi:dihydrolipoyllysine-residue acetyltransferase [Alteromonas lipolytica]|uniref:Dihydrolipoamide acetyltransferase component of pyruvate dehydrogenase complex n=1 Tax=Alteromonas lipolytica TaxID=1856405 RepID=A0A1E8FI38_9ALTE|nr:dihydrolipoyllysine-residue acetyltransferase [Alteromonas lipolytica]OFI35143.1 dihydrolipoamide acetyltransferase [Alteromonas lipolytica]GGF57049.1 dihydrolipoamide acetyltransferase component of pyruvate dehydrogenase complex [Alteromonas lipolytica]